MVRFRLAEAMWGVLLVTGRARTAPVGAPSEQLRATVDHVVATLANPMLRGQARAEERRQALHQATETAFAWPEMARRSLGLHWKKLGPAEQEEFTHLFRDLVERAWAATVEHHAGERITYVAEVTDGDVATVRTRLTLRGGQDAAIDYRMMCQGDRWLIYDVVLENASLVARYRQQFDRIMQVASCRDLIARIRARLRGPGASL